MFSFNRYFLASNIEEAYNELLKNKKNIILGGTSFLRLSNMNYSTAIDLSNLNLSYIKENENSVHIGALTPFRELETNKILNEYFDNIFYKTLKDIVGVQFRNNVVIGATVFSKYGFSDLITTLLALNAKIKLFKGGVLELEDFLNEKAIRRDILLEVIIPKISLKASFQSLRKSKSDYSVLNLTLVKYGNSTRIAVGARPGKAVLFSGEEINFSSNMRGSKEYREVLFKNLLTKAKMEVEYDS